MEGVRPRHLTLSARAGRGRRDREHAQGRNVMLYRDGVPRSRSSGQYIRIRGAFSNASPVTWWISVPSE